MCSLGSALDHMQEELAQSLVAFSDKLSAFGENGTRRLTTPASVLVRVWAGVRAGDGRRQRRTLALGTPFLLKKRPQALNSVGAPTHPGRATF